mmetsp:Transcript_47677/g.136626  ORF Transcript_47677/g.136626 Transcript_47677/m.136626 type:complete len:428 (-) Transcript_47677:81-1364(-)
MSGFFRWRWLACVLVCGLLSVRNVEAKMVMGIADGQDYQLVTTFCFTFPPPGAPGAPGVPAPNGHIHSQTIVSSNGHKFLVLNVSDLQRGLSCEELVKRAKVIEPLSEKTREVIAYDLTLNVEPSMNRQNIAAVIARCGQPVNAEYIVEFTNPGGSWEEHFACSDQGLLQIYLWFAVGAGVLGAFAATAQRVLHRRQAHNDVSALFFAGTAFFVARIWLFTVHLLVYSRNGMGLGMLLFVAQYLDFLSNTMGMLVLMAMVHGVYVTRPCVPPGSGERQVLMQVVGAFTATYLLSTLMCGFKFDALLSPFGVLRGAASWPYLIARAWTGVFCFNRGIKLAATDEAQQKKPYILRFSILALGWLVIIPVIVLCAGEDSWNEAALVMDLANFLMFGIVLHDFWPSRFGTLFSCMKPTERMHPYSEFGLSD